LVKEANNGAAVDAQQKQAKKPPVKVGDQARIDGPPMAQFYSSIPDDEDEVKETSSLNEEALENTNPDHATESDFVPNKVILAHSIEMDNSGSEFLQVPKKGNHHQT